MSIESMEVAQNIIAQLGGQRFVMMTGARQLMYTGRGVRFRLPSARQKINVVEITLNAADTYDVQFMRVRGFDAKVVSESSGVFCDQLRELFEGQTGLATRI